MLEYLNDCDKDRDIEERGDKWRARSLLFFLSLTLNMFNGLRPISSTESPKMRQQRPDTVQTASGPY